MAPPKRRWPLALLPPVFLALVLALAYLQDPHFYLDPEALYHRAKETEKQGNLEQALILAQKSWKRSPENSDCGQFLGWLYLKQGKPEPALEILQPLWNRDPAAINALKGIAQALNLMDRRTEALELLGNYLRDNPQEAEVLLFAAQLAGQGEATKPLAMDYYQQHYRLQPTPQVRRTLLDLLTASQRFKEAIPLQEEEAAQNPDQPEAFAPFGPVALLAPGL